MRKRFTEQDLCANYVKKLLDDAEINDARLKGIKLVDKANYKLYESLEYRDAYYKVIKMINKEKHIGHAICLVGLRRTGKSVLLNQLHINSKEFGIESSEVLHITLSAFFEKKEITRDRLDCKKLDKNDKIQYPTLEDIEQFIKQVKSYKEIKCIMIDEVTLCKDLILAGKGFIDSLVDSGMIVILAGTESASFNLASENSLYSRLILEDISYIPFGEYCRLKKISLSSLEEKQVAIERYIAHGNILDDTVNVDDKYIESALGINVALSIINSDFEEFIGCENDVRELVQSVIKYFKLIGESITISGIKAALTRADITRAIDNENKRRKREGIEVIEIDKPIRTQIAVEAAEELFEQYNLNLGLSQIQLSIQQLSKIDELFTQMGLIYNLSMIPEIIATNGAVDADDLTILHSLSYNIIKNISNKVLSKPLGLSDEDVQILANEIESTANGRLLEGIVTLQLLKVIEKQQKLLTCLKSYGNGKFETERKCSKHRMYKYKNKIVEDTNIVTAEIDIVMPEDDIINLIEIKKSSVVDENQTRWLNNITVQNEIREKISMSKPFKKYVYYLGEDMKIDDIYYRNIVDVLLENYNQYFKEVI